MWTSSRAGVRVPVSALACTDGASALEYSCYQFCNNILLQKDAVWSERGLDGSLATQRLPDWSAYGNLVTSPLNSI